MHLIIINHYLDKSCLTQVIVKEPRREKKQLPQCIQESNKIMTKTFKRTDSQTQPHSA